MYLGGGMGNAGMIGSTVEKHDSYLVKRRLTAITCEVQILTQDIFRGTNMDINYFKSAKVIYDQIEELEIQLANINEQMKYRRRIEKGKSISIKPNWILRLEGISDTEIDCDDELVQIICSYLSEKRDKLKEKFEEI